MLYPVEQGGPIAETLKRNPLSNTWTNHGANVGNSCFVILYPVRQKGECARVIYITYIILLLYLCFVMLYPVEQGWDGRVARVRGARSGHCWSPTNLVPVSIHLQKPTWYQKVSTYKNQLGTSKYPLTNVVRTSAFQQKPTWEEQVRSFTNQLGKNKIHSKVSVNYV